MENTPKNWEAPYEKGRLVRYDLHGPVRKVHSLQNYNIANSELWTYKFVSGSCILHKVDSLAMHTNNVKNEDLYGLCAVISWTKTFVTQVEKGL